MINPDALNFFIPRQIYIILHNIHNPWPNQRIYIIQGGSRETDISEKKHSFVSFNHRQFYLYKTKVTLCHFKLKIHFFRFCKSCVTQTTSVIVTNTHLQSL